MNLLGFFLTLVEPEALAAAGLGGANEEVAPLLGADEEAPLLGADEEAPLPRAYEEATVLPAEVAATLAPEASETAAVALAPDDDAAAFLVPLAAALGVDGGAVLVSYTCKVFALLL